MMDISTSENININFNEAKTMNVDLSVGTWGGSSHTHNNKEILDSITQEKIDSWENNNIDLSIYQTKTDNTLNSTSKTIVGAINENNLALANKSDIGHTHSEYSLTTHTHSLQTNCDTVDNLHFLCLTRTQFDALATKDSSTVYLVKEG